MPDHIGWYWARSSELTPATGEFRVIIYGWWIRVIWGLTFNPRRLRLRRCDGHRLLAVRLWGTCSDGRLVGIQWQRASNRLTVDGRRVSA